MLRRIYFLCKKLVKPKILILLVVVKRLVEPTILILLVDDLIKLYT